MLAFSKSCHVQKIGAKVERHSAEAAALPIVCEATQRKVSVLYRNGDDSLQSLPVCPKRCRERRSLISDGPRLALENP